MLEIEHADPDLARLETDASYTAGFAVPVIKQFRVLMQTIRTVSSRLGLYQFRGRRLEKLQGQRHHQHSMRLNRKWRLIVEFFGGVSDDEKAPDAKPTEKIKIVAIENHYDD